MVCLDKEVNNKCIVCGDIAYSKLLCYSHFKLLHRKLLRKIKLYKESPAAIKQTILEAENLLKNNRSLKHKEDSCKVCGQPCDGELCAMHRKFNR